MELTIWQFGVRQFGEVKLAIWKLGFHDLAKWTWQFVKVNVNLAFWQSGLDKEENVNLAKIAKFKGVSRVGVGSPWLTLGIISPPEFGFQLGQAAEEIVSLKQIKIVEKNFIHFFTKDNDIYKIYKCLCDFLS